MSARVSDPVKIRVHGLYGRMIQRFAEKRWRSGKRQGQLREPAIPIPIIEAELCEWLKAAFPLGCALPCRYCGAPIDAMSCSLDHAIPVARGGHINLDNLEAICERCNQLKGGLTPTEFTRLMVWILEQHPAAQNDVMKRLLAGAMGMRLRYFKK